MGRATGKGRYGTPVHERIDLLKQGVEPQPFWRGEPHLRIRHRPCRPSLAQPAFELVEKSTVEHLQLATPKSTERAAPHLVALLGSASSRPGFRALYRPDEARRCELAEVIARSRVREPGRARHLGRRHSTRGDNAEDPEAVRTRQRSESTI